MYPPRYASVDGWRGLAAIVVVLGHMNPVMIVAAEWAVVVFFVISGYCITASAITCRRKDVSFLAYMARRVRRIYPPYFFSIIYYLITRLVKIWGLGQPDRVTELGALQWVQNFTMTQWLSLLWEPRPVASHNPTNFMAVYWSLNYEEQFYLVFAIGLGLAYRFKISLGRFLLFVSLASAMWILGFWKLCYGVFFEYWPMFGAGVLVYYRLCVIQSVLLRRGVELMLACALIFGVVVWFLDIAGASRHWESDLILSGGFSLLLIFLRSWDIPWASSKLGRWLGRLGLISYSLYLIHQSNLMFVNRVVGWSMPQGTPWVLLQGAELGLHIAIAACFWWCFERPFLNQPLKATTPANLPVRCSGPKKPEPLF